MSLFNSYYLKFDYISLSSAYCYSTLINDCVICFLSNRILFSCSICSKIFFCLSMNSGVGFNSPFNIYSVDSEFNLLLDFYCTIFGWWYSFFIYSGVSSIRGSSCFILRLSFTKIFYICSF